MGYSPWGHEESDMTGRLHDFTTMTILLCVCVCVCDIFLSQFSIDRHVGCFHVLVILNSADVGCMCLLKLEYLLFSRYISMSGMAESYGNSF